MTIFTFFQICLLDLIGMSSVSFTNNSKGIAMRIEIVSFKGHHVLYANGEPIAHAYRPEQKAELQTLYEKLLQRMGQNPADSAE